MFIIPSCLYLILNYSIVHNKSATFFKILFYAFFARFSHAFRGDAVTRLAEGRACAPHGTYNIIRPIYQHPNNFLYMADFLRGDSALLSFR